SLGRRTGVAGARRHLQRAELNGFTDPHVEIDNAAGDLVEAGEQGGGVDDLVGGWLGDDIVARRQRGFDLAARLALALRQSGKGTGGVGGGARWRRQRLRLQVRRPLPIDRRQRTGVGRL